MEEKQNELYIPSNIKTRLEFFKGYGVKEMIITLVVMIFSLPIAFALYNSRFRPAKVQLSQIRLLFRNPYLK